jgi:hypothetical protein
MLEGGEVEHIVISGPICHEGIKNIRAAVNGEGRKLSVNITEGTADIPNQLHHIVFADVYHMEQFRAAFEYFPNHGGTDGTGAAYDQETGG